MNDIEILMSCMNAKMDVMKTQQDAGKEQLAAVKAVLSVQSKETQALVESISLLGDAIAKASEELMKARSDINELCMMINEMQDQVDQKEEYEATIRLLECMSEENIKTEEEKPEEEKKVNLIHLAGGGTIRRTWPDQEGVISMVNGGWTYDQIADEYGVDKQAVYNCVYNARKSGKLK